MLFQPASPWKASKHGATVDAPLRQVTVWLDALTPAQGAFAHALEWAMILRLPIHGVVSKYGSSEATPTAALEACRATCEREGVAWSYSCEDLDEKTVIGRQELEHDFCILSGAQPRALQKHLLTAALAWPHAGPLLCPVNGRSLRRALVVQEGGSPTHGYLENAATICHRAGCPVSVLTLSLSEEAAGRLQDSARKTFDGQNVPADFHTVIGRNAQGAIPMVAGWRRCTHVFVAKSAPSAWRRWFGFGGSGPVRELADRFAVLPVPTTRLSLSSLVPTDSLPNRAGG